MRGMNRMWAVCLSGAALLLAQAVSRAQAPPSFTISTVAGNGAGGFGGDGSAASSAQIFYPYSIALDSSGNYYIADQFNHRIRKVTSGTISTVAGSGTAGYEGDNAAATSAKLLYPVAAAIDSSGNLYIADTANHCIRKVTSGGTISTFAGRGAAIFGYDGDGFSATSAYLHSPTAVAIDAAGAVYIADSGNGAIRKVTSDGLIATFAGTGTNGYSGDEGLATDAQLNNPIAIVFDGAGNLYISDSGNNRIRKITTDGIIHTIAGASGLDGFSGDGGPALQAKLADPKGITLDSAGNLYIADSFNNRIRMITPQGTITTVAGNGVAGYSGDDVAATSTRLYQPSGVAAAAGGKIYVTDNRNNRIRLLTPVVRVPAVSSGGVLTAGEFGGFSTVAPGTWVEIYGSNLATDAREWAGTDFNGSTAPTSLLGTSATVGGQPAYVRYVSPGQVNVQVPSNIGTGSQPVVLTTPYGTTAAVQVTVGTTQPGLYAPPNLKIGGKQYVVAILPDGQGYAIPTGIAPGVLSRPAKPGETLVLYGVGFGAVTPNVPAGQIAQGQTALASPVQVYFGTTPATVTYQGLAPGYVGLYQLNVVVPNVAAGDAVPLSFSQGGANGAQTLYIAVQN